MNKNIEIAEKIAKEVNKESGKAYYVGGFVRDKLLGIENKDIDIEIHNIEINKLEEILNKIGEVIKIGESFGVYGLKGFDIDIAVPRKEKVIGKGHKDFEIFCDPFIGTYKAALRRDITINALLEDVLSHEIIDHFNGLDDLKNKIIRHVNQDSFIEDPLRVLRVCQFASRFEFEVANETIELCKKMDLKALAKERIVEELDKALLKSKKPSIFFETLDKMNQLDYWFKELKDLKEVKQNPSYHAEGSAYVHTLMVMDEGAKYLDKVNNPRFFMYSCLCHDFGKAVATTIDEKGIIHCYNHEILGMPLAEEFIKRLTNETKLLDYVLNMCKNHMRLIILNDPKTSNKACNHLFDESIDPLDLLYIGLADDRGRLPNDYVYDFDVMYQKYLFYLDTMKKDYVTGKDLLDANIKPGPIYHKALDYAHKLRLANVDKENSLKHTLSYIKELEREEND